MSAAGNRGTPASSGERSSSASTLSIIKAQIVFLLSTLTEDSYAKNEKEINALIDAHGADANIHLVRRLVNSAALALAQPLGSPVSSPTPSSHLNLRLLSSCTVKLASDPVLTSRFREAILAGFNDTSSGSASSEPFRQLADHFPDFCDRIGLTNLQKLILSFEMVKVLVPPQQSADTPAAQQSPALRNAVALHAKSKDFGLAAVRVLRDSWETGLEELAARRFPDVLGPVGLSRLISATISDLVVDVNNGEIIVADAPEADMLLNTEQKRQLIRALRARVGAELAPQIVNHALDPHAHEPAQLAPGTSPVELLHRLVPDAAFSTPDLIRSVLLSTKKLPSTPVSPTSEVACASLISALIDLFSRHGDLVGIDPVVFVAVIEHFIPPESPLSSIILHSFDAPPDDPQAILPPLPETTGLRALARILSSSTAAAQVLWADWVSSARQLSLLERLLCQPIEVFPLGGLPDLPKVVTPEDVAIASPIVRSQAQALYPCAWNCRELVNLLMRMLGSAQSKQAAEDEDMAITAMVGDVLERAMKEAPELFVIGLAQMEPSLYRDNLLSRLAPGFLSGQSGYQLVFHRLLQIDSERVTSMLAQHYAEDQMNVARIVDIALELDVMPRLLEAHSWGFVLDVASLAARRDILQLPLYLRSTVSQYGSTFVKEALAFVGYKIRSDLERHQNDHPSEPHTMPLTPEVFADFLKALRQNHELFAPGDVDMFKEIRSSGLQLFPSLLTFGPQTEAEQSMVPATFSPDLEAEVDSLFRKMYNDEASAQELVTTLQRARDSGNPVQLEFFECTLHVLMDELRFVGAYPVKERDLTAQLFGRLILHQVIDGIPLGIAVRIVRDNLQKSPDTPSYHFGIMALNQFLDRLQDWPQLLRNILDIPHLPEASPETHARLLRIGHETNDGSNGLETSLAGPAFTALQAGEPDMALEEPGGKSADMVKFEINNLTAKELPGRVREAARHLEEKHCRWLAHHMINSRVCVEPNNHGLYLEFIDKLGFARLHKQILYETLHKSASLLNLESTLSSSAERGLLKNLGVWLGLITLARNRPIKYDHVAFKELLIEGFDSGRLIVAIPFVCKVLEQCSKSKVFKPPNPWLMAIIRLLVELYQFAELKLNLKFEIEVLCKALGIDLKEVEPTSILRQRPSPDEQMESAADGVVSRQNASKPSSLTTVADQTSESLHQVIDLALEKLPALLVFSNNVPFVTANPSIKRVVHVAIDKAIRDIIVPVVERSVTIAGITSKELVLKDFAAEGDEDKLARSAELTVQNLAGSLALVTCKEPLRLSIIQHLKTGFVQSGFAEHHLPEPAISVLANDNLEVACSVVERVAMDRGKREILNLLSGAVIMRRKHREQSSSPFCDTSALPPPQYTNLLPDFLRLKPHGLEAAQQQVYGNFGKVRAVTDGPVDSRAADYDGGRISTPVDSLGGAPLYPVPTAVEKFTKILAELDASVHEEPATSLAELPQSSVILTVLAQLPLLASRSNSVDDSALLCSQKVIQVLFRADSELAREVASALLERLCGLSDSTAQKIRAWLVFANDERKFNLPVVSILIKQGVLGLSDFEGQLAKVVLKESQPSTINFLSQLVRHLLTNKIASREQLMRAIEALFRVNQQGMGTELSHRLETDLKRDNKQPMVLREKLIRHFVDWVRWYQGPKQDEDAFQDYIDSLQEDGVLTSENLMSLFFRTATEVCVENYMKQTANGGTADTGIYTPVDALGTLVTLLLKYSGRGGDAQDEVRNKARYMHKVLSIIVLVLCKQHEDLEHHFAVAQKPLYRLFSSLFTNFTQMGGHLSMALPELYAELCNALNNVNPTFFPGFAFSWVALISHRGFLPKVMQWPACQTTYVRLLKGLLRFLRPHLQHTPMTETIRALYMSTCKLFLVLLHDYPHVLALHHNALCDAVPQSCLQLQNIILSAYPSEMSLPDPFSPEAGVTLQKASAPQVTIDYGAQLATAAPDIFLAIDALHKGQGNIDMVVASTAPLQIQPQFVESGSPLYNRQLVTALIMTVLANASAEGASFEHGNVNVKIFEALLEDLDAEGRYTLLSSLIAQLRYPNTQSRWASACVLHLFETEGTDNFTKEVILRILLERVSCMRPHPWSLVYTLVELLRHNNPEEMECLERPELKAVLVPLLDRLRRKC